MKRIALLLIICLTAMGSWAQQDTLVYHPFVEQGKFWRVHSNNWRPTNIMTTYYFAWEKNLFERDGRNYEALYSRTDDGSEQIEGLLREEDGRVYLYNERQGREILLYDFTLDVGDEVDLEVYGNSRFTVTSVDELVVNGERLKSILLTSNDRTEEEDATAINWVEGIGTLCTPIYDDGHVWWEDLAYVWSPTYYLPFTFGVPFAGWRGTDLVRTRELHGSELTAAEDSLSYEFVPDPARDCYSLHVSGRMWTHCGPNNYVYCVSERGTDIGVERVRLVKEAMQDTDCEGLYMVDFYFPFFPGATCYVIDNRGEHLVPHAEPAAYHPFVEEGKTWEVGLLPPGTSEAVEVESYFISSDTIVGRQPAKRLMCEQLTKSCRQLSYVGALVEDNKQVLFALPGSTDFQLLYDFGAAEGTALRVFNAYERTLTDAVVAQKYIETVSYWSYPAIILAWDGRVEASDPWFEGIGSLKSPLVSVPRYTGDDRSLLRCAVGDLTLYEHPHYNDTLTAYYEMIDEAKKQRLDFTHVVKPRPRGTSAAAEGSAVEGAYNEYKVDIDFRQLYGSYQVIVRDESSQVLFEQSCDASTLESLTINIHDFAASSLTLTIENAEEQYVATLLLDIENGIVDIYENGIPTTDTEIVNGKSVNGQCYDLSGRRLAVPSLRSQSSSVSSVPSALPKGVYVQRGSKIVVR